MLAVIQQITGINTVIYFAPTVLRQAGLGSSAALLALVVVGVTNVDHDRRRRSATSTASAAARC